MHSSRQWTGKAGKPRKLEGVKESNQAAVGNRISAGRGRKRHTVEARHKGSPGANIARDARQLGQYGARADAYFIHFSNGDVIVGLTYYASKKKSNPDKYNTTWVNK